MTTGPEFTVSNVDRGTVESTWLDALLALDPPALAVPPPKRVVVVAPHPDDEVLGIGGLVRRWANDGTEVVVVAVTDGERSDPRAGRLGRIAGGIRRAHESRLALRELGVVADVRRLSLPDGTVVDHEPAVQEAVEAATVADTVCAATWRGDGHPDHEATGRAAAGACRSTGARLLEFPVWMWHWAGPADQRVPWASAQAEFLDASTLRAKRDALDLFRSQVRGRRSLRSGLRRTEPVLPPSVLRRFHRPFELVFT